MADCCTFGEVFFSVDGAMYSFKGEWTVMEGGLSYSYDEAANLASDGTITPTARRRPWELSGGNLTGCQALPPLKCGVDLMLQIGTGAGAKTLSMPDAVVVGRPETNTTTGDVSGISFVSTRGRWD